MWLSVHTCIDKTNHLKEIRDDYHKWIKNTNEETRAIIYMEYSEVKIDENRESYIEKTKYVDLISIKTCDISTHIDIYNYAAHGSTNDSFVFIGDKPIKYMGKRYTPDEFNIVVNLMF